MGPAQPHLSLLNYGTQESENGSVKHRRHRFSKKACKRFFITVEVQCISILQTILLYTFKSKEIADKESEM